MPFYLPHWTGMKNNRNKKSSKILQTINKWILNLQVLLTKLTPSDNGTNRWAKQPELHSINNNNQILVSQLSNSNQTVYNKDLIAPIKILRNPNTKWQLTT
jgi:hypothetical protein